MMSPLVFSRGGHLDNHQLFANDFLSFRWCGTLMTAMSLFESCFVRFCSTHQFVVVVSTTMVMRLEIRFVVGNPDCQNCRMLKARARNQQIGDLIKGRLPGFQPEPIWYLFHALLLLNSLGRFVGIDFAQTADSAPSTTRAMHHRSGMETSSLESPRSQYPMHVGLCVRSRNGKRNSSLTQ